MEAKSKEYIEGTIIICVRANGSKDEYSCVMRNLDDEGITVVFTIVKNARVFHTVNHSQLYSSGR